MQRYVWTLILPMFLGCAGKNVVSGDGKPTEEELKADVPSWCQSMCGKFDSCLKALPCDCEGDACECDSSPRKCVETCTEDLTHFARSPECIEIAVKVHDCFEQSSCEQLLDEEHPPSCFPKQGYEGCRGEDDEGDEGPPVSGSGGSTHDVDGGTAGGIYGGTANGGPSFPGTAGTSSGTAGAPSSPAVICKGASGSGAGGSPNSGGAYVTCEESRGDCSDGNEYEYVCVDQAGGHNFCSCFLNGALVGALDPELTCPSVGELNLACGWNLKE
jgi:hypothetical protein